MQQCLKKEIFFKRYLKEKECFISTDLQNKKKCFSEDYLSAAVGCLLLLSRLVSSKFASNYLNKKAIVVYLILKST